MRLGRRSWWCVDAATWRTGENERPLFFGGGERSTTRRRGLVVLQRQRSGGAGEVSARCSGQLLLRAVLCLLTRSHVCLCLWDDRGAIRSDQLQFAVSARVCRPRRSCCCCCCCCATANGSLSTSPAARVVRTTLARRWRPRCVDDKTARSRDRERERERALQCRNGCSPWSRCRSRFTLRHGAARSGSPLAIRNDGTGCRASPLRLPHPPSAQNHAISRALSPQTSAFRL